MADSDADSKNPRGKQTHPLEALIPSILRVVFQPHWIEITFPRYTVSQYLKACLCKYQELLDSLQQKPLTPSDMLNRHQPELQAASWNTCAQASKESPPPPRTA